MSLTVAGKKQSAQHRNNKGNQVIQNDADNGGKIQEHCEKKSHKGRDYRDDDTGSNRGPVLAEHMLSGKALDFHG